MKRSLRVLLKASLGMGIILIILYKLNIIKLISAFASFKLWVLVLVIPYYFIWNIFNTLNLWLLYDAIEERVSFKLLYLNFLKAWAVGRFSPGRFGEYSIAYFLRKKINYRKSIVVITIDKAITLFGLVFFALLGGFYFLKEIVPTIVGFSFLLILALISGYFFITSPIFQKLIQKKIFKKISKYISDIPNNLNFLVEGGKRKIVLNLTITVIRILFSGIVIYLSFLSAGVHAPLILIISINSIGALVSFVPISISGLGTKEATVIYLFTLGGINPIIAGAVALLYRFVSYIIAGCLVEYELLRMSR